MPNHQTYQMAIISISQHLTELLYQHTPKTPSVEESAHAVRFAISSANKIWYPDPMLHIDFYITLDRMKLNIMAHINSAAKTATSRLEIILAMLFGETVGMPEPNKATATNLANAIKTFLEATKFVNELE